MTASIPARFRNIASTGPATPQPMISPRLLMISLSPRNLVTATEKHAARAVVGQGGRVHDVHGGLFGFALGSRHHAGPGHARVDRVDEHTGAGGLRGQH